LRETKRKAGGFPGGVAATVGEEDTVSVEYGISRCHAPNNLPERNAYFTGRGEKLDSIHTGFSKGNMICVKQTIAGLGGVGKTQTTLEYAYRFGSGYDDAIWWIRAETEATAFNDLLSFAEDSGLIPEGLDEARKLTLEQLAKRLKGWFAAHRSWLFIFDNVEQVEDIEPYTSVMQTGHRLITTRDRELRQGASVNIDLFTTEESIAFMHMRLSECPHLIEVLLRISAISTPERNQK